MHTATVTDVWVEEELEQTNTWEIHGLWFPPQMRAYDRACGNGVAFCCCCLIWRKREKEWETQTLAGKKTTITTLMCVCVGPESFRSKLSELSIAAYRCKTNNFLPCFHADLYTQFRLTASLASAHTRTRHMHGPNANVLQMDFLNQTYISFLV